MSATLLPWEPVTAALFKAAADAEAFEIQVRYLTVRSASRARRLRQRLDRLGPFARDEWKRRELMGWAHPETRMRVARLKAQNAF